MITISSALDLSKENKLFWGFLDPTTQIGDLLTIITILITLYSLRNTLNKDRMLREKDQADKVRDGAARMIAKLDRWRELSLAMFPDMDIAFVETSEEMRRMFDSQNARDSLWKKLNAIKSSIFEKVLAEDIETAYADLYGYDPHVREFYEKVLFRLKEEETVMFKKGILCRTQNEILYNHKDIDSFRTNDMRNGLMRHAEDVHSKYKLRLHEIIKPVEALLLELISKSDQELLGQWRPCYENSLEAIPEKNRYAYEEKIIEFLYAY